MSQEVQEIRQVMTWDTTDAESGAVRMERAFKRIEEAEKRTADQSRKVQGSAKPPGAAKGAGHGNDSNLVAGIRDLAEGRLQNAMTRFTQSAKLTGLAVTGVFAAYKIGSSAIEHYKEQLEATDNASARLRQSLQGLSKAATFSSTAEGASKLAGTRESLREQIQGEKELQSELERTKAVQNWEGKGKGAEVANYMLGGLPKDISTGYKVYDSLRSESYGGWNPFFSGAQSTDEKLDESKTRERLAAQHFNKLGKEVTGAYGRDRDIARERSVVGNPFEAQRMEMAKQQELAEKEAQSSGNGSPQNIALIRERFALEKEGIDRAEAAADRQLDLEEALIRAKKEGGAVEVKSARERLAAAGKALAQEVVGTKGFREKQSAYFTAKTDSALADRAHTTQGADFRFDLGAASNRGNDEERARAQADAAVGKARERLRILQQTKDVQASEKEIMDAQLSVAQALTQQEMLHRQQTVAGMRLQSSIQNARTDVAGGGAMLRGASSEQAERAGLQAQAQIALENYNLAAKTARENRNSVEAREAEVGAAKELAKAQVAVALHDQQVRRERKLTMESVRGETASLRFSAGGRDDLADLTSQRTGSSVAIQRANLAGHPVEAAELAEQQRLRERKSVHDLYLNEDGTKRNAFDVQKELRDRQIKQTRVAQFDSALDRNGGLLSVHRDINGRVESGVDPLTGQRLNAREIADRNAAAKADPDAKNEKLGDHEIFSKILTALETRLPEAAN